MPGQGNRIDFVTGAPEKYADLVDAISMIPAKVRATVAGASDGTMRQEPAGGWSALRHLGHLALLAEANDVFLHQMAKMTTPVRAHLEPGEISEEIEALPVAAILQRIDHAFGRTVELLSHTPDAAWGRPGEVRGMRRSLRQQVVNHAAHFDEHLVEIAKLIGTAVTAR